MAPKKSVTLWLTTKWVGNNSPKYDGVVHLINAKYVHPEDVASMAVVKMVRVKRGEGGGPGKRRW
jgi:hypothetical protein